jgi:hypothetical protein
MKHGVVKHALQNIAYFSLVVVSWSFLGWYMQSCASSGPGADRLVLDHQQQITKLEDRNQDLERRLDQYDSAVGSSIEQLEAIGERARGMEGTVDEIIALFGEYQRRVDELTQAYNDIKNEAGHSN